MALAPVLLALAGPLLGGDPGPRNALLLIADDVGVDRVGAYGVHPEPGSTPHLDALAARGVLFRNAWANPTCSPTRATILTGRYSFRNGVGKALVKTVDPVFGPVEDYALPLGEVTLPELLERGTGGAMACAALGKWHLAGPVRAPLHPLECGFHTHRGSLFNLEGFYGWMKTVDGVTASTNTYATTDTVDDALELIATLPEPWFLWVAFNASHKPFHKPPAHLVEELPRSSPEADPAGHMKAMTEALDAEIGRLLEALEGDVGSRTHVLFVSDNGTPKPAITPPFDPAQGKSTLYQGGVHVPLIVAGPRVARPGAECHALVDTTDLFLTIAELCGVEVDDAALPAGYALDSVSLVPYLEDPGRPSRRSFAYAERFSPNGPPPWTLHRRAVRGERYKLIRRAADEEELYDLWADPYETTDLLQAPLTPDAEAAHASLRAVLRDLSSS